MNLCMCEGHGNDQGAALLAVCCACYRFVCMSVQSRSVQISTIPLVTCLARVCVTLPPMHV